MTLTDKVILITGVTSGIGKAMVEVFGNEGCKVVAVARSEEKLRTVSAEWSEMGFDFLTVVADISVEDDNRKMVEEAVKHFGKIDILLTNAGISMRALFQDLDLDVFKKVMDTNFYGAVYAVKYALPYLKKSGGGIIAISSINGHRGTPARTAYTASKFAVQGFFEALRTELMHDNMHILVVSPGFTGSNIRKSALNATGEAQGESPRDESKMMTAQEVAQKTLKAWKKGKRHLLLTWEGTLLVFFNKFVPAWMDRIVYKRMAKEPNSPFK